MRKCFLSKNYKETASAGNKAKTDVEQIMLTNGFVNIGFKQTTYTNPVLGFLITLLSVLKAVVCLRKGDLLVLQYPFKKYFSFICRMAWLKDVKIVVLVHDLGSFRRKKLSPEKEKSILSQTDYLIVVNEFMRNWLVEQGYSQPINSLVLWDYLSPVEPLERPVPPICKEIIHAGSLSLKKHSFMYKLETTLTTDSCRFTLYGKDFISERVIHRDKLIDRGFVTPDQFIATVSGDFGLVWYGHSIHEIDGVYGEYLKITTSHKISLYLRCHIPVIVWNQSAVAPFVRSNGIGICVSSLTEIDRLLPTITPEEYRKMKENTIRLSKKVAAGHFFMTAYKEAEKTLIHATN